MLHGGLSGALELRRMPGGAVRLSGRFPYNSETTLVPPGRGQPARREVIAARAFAPRIDRGEDVHLLIGHDFDRPLASRAAGSLILTDTAAALEIAAEIAAELRAAPYVQDFLGALEAGLIRGLSPGFRIADTAGAEEVRSDGAGLLRTVRAAELYELSAVTVPAYGEAQITARRWARFDSTAERDGRARAAFRWRA
jgi:HK97 family phage prohead protease